MFNGYNYPTIMPTIERTSDIKESLTERALFFFIGSVVLIACGVVFLVFRGDGYFVFLGEILVVLGAVSLVTAIYGLSRTRKVTSFDVHCPFCQALNVLTVGPEDDFNCTSCNRMIPIENGAVLPAEQVRCGFCGELNFYSAKTEVLICENCDHEIPISQDETGKPKKQLPKAFQVTDDTDLYSLILTEAGKNNDEMISTLQQMLALNRNQVKDILDTLPATLLQGINRRKAEMLQAQLAIHGAQAEITTMAL